jgi:hypothetical protein
VTESPCPIVDVDFSSPSAATIDVPGYVSVPMGAVYLAAQSPGFAGSKDVSFGGGILAAQVQVGPVVPASLQFGLVQAVVQQTFKIVTETTSGSPRMRATAIVQVNQTGGYAINSYSVEQL